MSVIGDRQNLGSVLSKHMTHVQRTGDEEVYEELLETTRSLLLKYFRKRIPNQQIRDDLVQETLLGIHKARSTYQAGRPYLSWMYAIAHHKYVDYVRKNKNIMSREVEWTHDDVIFAHSKIEKDSMIRDALQEGWSELNENQRKTFSLMKIEGLSVKETSEKLGASQSAVKVWLYRARKFLQKRYKESMDE